MKTTQITPGIKSYTCHDTYREGARLHGAFTVETYIVETAYSEYRKPVHSPDTFVQSDETGCMCRFYVDCIFETGEVRRISKMQFKGKFGFNPFPITVEDISELKSGYYIVRDGEIQKILKAEAFIIKKDKMNVRTFIHVKKNEVEVTHIYNWFQNYRIVRNTFSEWNAENFPVEFKAWEDRMASVLWNADRYAGLHG